MFKFLIRLRTCWAIMTRKYNNWVLLSIDRENITRILTDKNSIEADLIYHGLQPYIVKKMIKMIAEGVRDVDLICDKAQFEADAQTYKTKK